MRRHRTTARGALLLLLLLGFAGVAGARGKPKRIVFPVLGSAHYIDDFGAPRAGGPHQGIDIMAVKKSLALAAEAGTIEFWTSSPTAGCMLYLHGASGTTYYYIHLNNDRTMRNDNRGRCVPGTAYARGLRNGSRVVAGQPVGFVGDSGDADGIHAHLHFEVHPGGGRAVDPYRYLKAAQHLLFAAREGTMFTLDLTGVVVSTTPTSLRIKLSALEVWPLGQKVGHLHRALMLSVDGATAVQFAPKKGAKTRPMRLATAVAGQPVEVVTTPDVATLRAERGDDLALSAGSVVLSPLTKTKR
jgi:hypothetical protein